MPKATIYLPDDLAEEARGHDINVSAVCQKALREEIDRIKREDRMAANMERIELELWIGPDDQPYRAAFNGRWLVEPDRDETRTSEPGYDAGAYYGVAITEKRQVAVYVAHCNDGWAPHLKTYDSLEEARENGLPDDFFAEAAGKVGEDFVVELNI